MTYFLTEENNFGVHSMSESHLSPNNTSDNPPEAKPETTGSQSKKGDKEKGITAIPAHVLEQTGHVHTPSIGSIMSPTVSTLSSPRHNFSSSAISDDSELELESHGEEETGGQGDSITSSFPQLVMPRVNMPQRKAFTEAGRTMGRLKIMVVGDSGASPFIAS
jgi:hypothetical protein